MRFLFYSLIAFLFPTAVVDANGRKPGELRVNPKDGQRSVWVPAGKFVIGCSPGDRECDDDETPSHQVVISKGLWMGET